MVLFTAPTSAGDGDEEEVLPVVLGRFQQKIKTSLLGLRPLSCGLMAVSQQGRKKKVMQLSWQEPSMPMEFALECKAHEPHVL